MNETRDDIANLGKVNMDLRDVSVRHSPFSKETLHQRRTALFSARQISEVEVSLESLGPSRSEIPRTFFKTLYVVQRNSKWGI